MDTNDIQVPVDTIIKRLQDQNSQLTLRVITLESWIEILQRNESMAVVQTEPTPPPMQQEIPNLVNP